MLYVLSKVTRSEKNDEEATVIHLKIPPCDFPARTEGIMKNRS
jgi:hypothetical protein